MRTSALKSPRAQLDKAGTSWPRGSSQLTLQAVDGQSDEQDQRDDADLDQAHFALDSAVFGPYRRLQRGQRLLDAGVFCALLSSSARYAGGSARGCVAARPGSA